MTVAAYPLERARDAFLAEYTLVDELAASLSDEQLLRPSRCLGWSVCDVLCHLDLGMVEILVALASPTDRPADTDFAAYWRDCCAPGEPDLGHARWIRLVASAYARPGGVVRHLRLTTGAALRQAPVAPADRRLEFQGHVIEMGDFLATWVVEAAVHHLDLTLELPDAPPPLPASLGVTRETLDALLGQPVPGNWDDATYALKGTERLPLTAEEAGALGPLAKRFPLFG
ncbi:MAG TPA: maleylpyruvate isomerase N-terminal domain-containing protein [Actinomycetes bacterium]